VEGLLTPYSIHETQILMNKKPYKYQFIFHSNKYIKIIVAEERVHEKRKGCMLNSSSPSGPAPF
jgi:hypothetical protein